MMAGHYATALVAHQRIGKGTLFYFLVASMLPDLLWLIFHFIGLEVTTPENVLDVSLNTLTVDMIYSHDLLPMFVWMVALYGLGRWIFKSHVVGLVGSLLLFVHNFVDYLGGYPHHVFGPDTPAIGTGAYYSAPLVAVAFEAVFIVVLLGVFFRTEKRRGDRRSKKSTAAIISLFAFNVAFLILVATKSPRETFGIPEFDSTFLGTMPNMVVTYWGMLLFLYFAVGNKTTEGSA